MLTEKEILAAFRGIGKTGWWRLGRGGGLYTWREENCSEMYVGTVEQTEIELEALWECSVHG